MIALLLLSLTWAEDFFESVRSELAFAERLEWGRAPLGQPPGVWVKLVCSPDKCLFYKTSGSLIFVEGKNPYDPAKITFSGARNLLLEREAFKSALLFESASKELVRQEFPHYNIRSSAPYKRYDPPSPPGLRRGLTIGRWPKESQAILPAGRLCHRVGRDCRDLVGNTCHLCREGHYEVVDVRCPGEGASFAGSTVAGSGIGRPVPGGFGRAGPKVRSAGTVGGPGFADGVCPLYATLGVS